MKQNKNGIDFTNVVDLTNYVAFESIASILNFPFPVKNIKVVQKGAEIIAACADFPGLSGIARCNPKDQFNRGMGIMLALLRLKLAVVEYKQWRPALNKDYIYLSKDEVNNKVEFSFRKRANQEMSIDAFNFIIGNCFRNEKTAMQYKSVMKGRIERSLFMLRDYWKGVNVNE